jgi:hypothetical protein
VKWSWARPRRQAARVVLVDGAGRVLLLRHSPDRDSGLKADPAYGAGVAQALGIPLADVRA